MPANVFANTPTSVSVLFFDRTEKTDGDKVILIDASKLGEEYKGGNNQKRRLRPEEVEKIVKTFRNKVTVEDFSVAVTYSSIKEKGFSLSVGQYFGIKINYNNITAEDFNKKMNDHKTNLKEMFEKSKKIENEIIENFGKLKYED